MSAQLSGFTDKTKVISGDGERPFGSFGSTPNRHSSENVGPWPDPKPVMAELEPVAAFNATEFLPPVLVSWVTDEAERMPCLIDFVAVTVIVSIGILIGARCAIKPKALDAWMIVPNVWGGLVGGVSGKKSPAWGAGLKALDRLIIAAKERHQAVLAAHETAMVVFEAKKDAIESRIKEAAKGKGTGTIEEIANELRTHMETAPRTPTLRRYKTNDTSVEKLGELLRDNPAGVLVMRDELVGNCSVGPRGA